MNPWSNRRLVLIFICALFAFIPLRWDATSWFEAQLQQIVQQLPVAVGIGVIDWSLKGISVEHVAITLPSPAKVLIIDSLTLSPAWGAWFQGSPTVHASLSSDGINGECDLLLHDGYVQLSAIELTANVPWLQAQWGKSIPMNLQGTLHVTGNLQAKQEMRQPVAGALTITWKEAGVQLGELVTLLGDYQLYIHDQPPASWQLQLAGGVLLKLDGQVVLQKQDTPWLQWPLQGTIAMVNAPDSPLAALLGAKQSIEISGNLQHPQWQM